MRYPMKAVPGYENSRSGIQVGTKMEGPISMDKAGKISVNEEGIRFLQQIGVEWVMVGHRNVPEHSARVYKLLGEKLAEYGLKIYRLENAELHNMPDVTLNLKNRDRMVDRYLKYLSDLGEAGIHYATYAHMGNGIWRGDLRRPVRGGATAGGLDLSAPNKGVWLSEQFNWPISSGREYGADELWENYDYFIKKVVPVAENAKVFIGIHPDDPPVYTMAGVPRPIFGSSDGYLRALDMAGSKNIGVCLCVGCWLEGGKEIGLDVVDFIKVLAARGQLFKLHVRNVTAPLSAPGGFNETYPDAGYYNLLNVLSALDQVGFDGAIMNDHLIDMVGGHYTCEAYFTAYLKGAVDAVQNRG
ncbi:MAG: mannonate dehydratase [Christensenellaceae bacterium]|jgi:mannonate dehydratase|nr:mannonate dehydratase [Christensenellaceae bacterium]